MHPFDNLGFPSPRRLNNSASVIVIEALISPLQVRFEIWMETNGNV
jgi:hypothetical protein